MKEINPRPEKSGDAGLDAFAGERAPGETVIDPDASEGPEDAPVAAEAPGGSETADETPGADATANQVIIWVSEDEPKRPLMSVSNAVYVLRNLIRDAETPAMAQTIFDRNLGLISSAGKESGDSLEAELQRRQKKAEAQQDGRAEGEAKPAKPKTVWLSPEKPAEDYTGEGNAIHLIRNGIREATTAAAAKTIRDQNAELIDAMPERIGQDLDFEVGKRFKQADQKKTGKLV